MSIIHFDAGKLNKRIDFIKKVKGYNELGQITLQDTVIKTVWAQVLPMRGYETTIEDRLQGRTMYTIFTRYHKDITQDMHIKFGDKTLEITQVLDVDSGHFALEITAMYRDNVKHD